MDKGYKESEKLLKDLEKKIQEEYSHAVDEMDKKIGAYLKKFEKDDEEKRKKVQSGKITQQEYQKWRTNRMITGKKWNEMKATLAEDLRNTNKIARSMAEGYMEDAYALNHNYGTFEVEKGYGIDTSYTLYNRDTVERLIRDDPDILPPPGKKMQRMINEGKVMQWQRRQVQSVVTQSILQGESVPKMAKRISTTLGARNSKDAIRYARTAMTGAQAAGRVDSYKRAQDLGIQLEQEWMATVDGKTRDSHIDLDGERVPVGEKFSNKCRFPGDPEGAPSEVYNCRCRIVAAIKGYNYRNDDRFMRLPDGMTYEDWKQHKLSRNYKEPTETHTVVNGKDISGTWTRRPDQFAFAIEDVINAQGFDGLPRIVSAREFDRLVKEANDGNGFIAQRTYSAPDQKTLDAYRDQLYHGKWYVDCSTGGAVNGQGMYCAANRTGVIDTSIRLEMQSYKNLGESKFEKAFDAGEVRQLKYEMATKRGDAIIANGGTNAQAREVYDLIMNMPEEEWAKKYAKELLPTKGVSYIETFTLDKSARLITKDELISIIDSMGLDGWEIMSKARTNDYGVFATILGYDGIMVSNAETTDVVILNRTKVIFKGE